ncbi:MAG TPA: type VI secretion system contractile sheath large subunit [Planctomicrobium sp.]|nr:type VI secretion system contractile sheath large subunit [Planctomicrobium sp.]
MIGQTQRSVLVTEAEVAPAAVTVRGAGTESGSILDGMLTVGERREIPRDSLERLLQARTVREGLTAFFSGAIPERRSEISDLLNRTVAVIDRLLQEQINVILHHPRFQHLEAAWRNLRYVVDCVDPDGPGKALIRVLDCSKSELFRDLDRAVEFDQSQTFDKIYSQEFGMAGGQPYGLLIGNYEISSHPDDVSLLANMSGVAAASFAPFVCAASPQILGLDSFRELERVTDFDRTFDPRINPQFTTWNSLRDSEDSRFVGLVMPRVMLRRPYRDDPSRSDGFLFAENWDRSTSEDSLWGNGAFSVGEVAIRSYQQNGWLANIRGVVPGREEGGVIAGLPENWFDTDARGLVAKPVTDVVVSESQERALCEAGFISMCHCPGTSLAAFYSVPSIQRPRKYDTNEASANARISGMLQYMLCVSLFARNIKVMTRDRIGSYAEAYECESDLNNWVAAYVTPSDDASPEVKARYPLREAKIEVRPHSSRPGVYSCTFHLQPHYELDDLTASVKLQTEFLAQR